MWSNWSNVGGRQSSGQYRAPARRFQVPQNTVGLTDADIQNAMNAVAAKSAARRARGPPPQFVRNTGASARLKRYDPGLAPVYTNFTQNAFAADAAFQCSPSRGCATKRPVDGAVRLASAKRLADLNKVAKILYDSPENYDQAGQAKMSRKAAQALAGHLYREVPVEYNRILNMRVSLV